MSKEDRLGVEVKFAWSGFNGSGEDHQGPCPIKGPIPVLWMQSSADQRVCAVCTATRMSVCISGPTHLARALLGRIWNATCLV